MDKKLNIKALLRFSLLMLVLSFPAVASSRDYKPIVDNGRIWECVCGEWGPYTIKYMSFDGEEEIGGKVYHRIVTFKKSVMDHSVEGQTPEPAYEFYDDVNEHEGYLREEDGKVYTLVVQEHEDSPYGALYIPTERYPSGHVVSERLIYDLSGAEGESRCLYSSTMGTGECIDFTTRTRSTETVDGEECVRIGIWPTENRDDHDMSYNVIEGVGPVEYGCLNYTEFIAHPTRPWMHNHFNRLFDRDGRVVYSTLESLDYRLPDNLFSSVGTMAAPLDITVSGGEISFTGNGSDNRLAIHDINGRLARTASGGGKLSVSTAGLQPGIYIAVCSVSGKVVARRKLMLN